MKLARVSKAAGLRVYMARPEIGYDKVYMIHACTCVYMYLVCCILHVHIQVCNSLILIVIILHLFPFLPLTVYEISNWMTDHPYVHELPKGAHVFLFVHTIFSLILLKSTPLLDILLPCLTKCVPLAYSVCFS